MCAQFSNTPQRLVADFVYWICLAAGSVILALTASTAPVDIKSTHLPAPAKDVQTLPVRDVPHHIYAYSALPTISSAEQAVSFAQQQ